jgi:hypothetical protein
MTNIHNKMFQIKLIKSVDKLILKFIKQINYLIERIQIIHQVN